MSEESEVMGGFRVVFQAAVATHNPTQPQTAGASLVGTDRQPACTLNGKALYQRDVVLLQNANRRLTAQCRHTEMEVIIRVTLF